MWNNMMDNRMNMYDKMRMQNMMNNPMNNMRYLMDDDVYGAQNRRRRSCCCCNNYNRSNRYRNMGNNCQVRQRYSDVGNSNFSYEDMMDYQMAKNNLYNAADNSWG